MDEEKGIHKTWRYEIIDFIKKDLVNLINTKILKTLKRRRLGYYAYIISQSFFLFIFIVNYL